MSGGFCDPYVFSSLPAWVTEGHSGAQTSAMCLALEFFLFWVGSPSNNLCLCPSQSWSYRRPQDVMWVLGPELWLS